MQTQIAPEIAHAQRDVAPAFAARRAIVKLSELLAFGAFVRVFFDRAAPRQTIENSEFALADALVVKDSDLMKRRVFGDKPRRFEGSEIRRREYHGRLFGL